MSNKKDICFKPLEDALLGGVSGGKAPIPTIKPVQPGTPLVDK